MTEAEYDAQWKEIRDDYISKCSALRKEYVRGIHTVKAGDVIEDHIGFVVVEKAGIHIQHLGYPVPRFFGLCLRKDGVPRKDKSKRWISWCNMKK